MGSLAGLETRDTRLPGGGQAADWKSAAQQADTPRAAAAGFRLSSSRPTGNLPARKNHMKNWSVNDILELGRGYQAASVLAAAADLELFDLLDRGPLTAAQAAEKIGGDLRATTALLDALAALELLAKSASVYSLPPDVARWLTARSPESVLGMAQHQANCLRRWAQLAQSVKSGRPAPVAPSIRGESADHAAFILAMHNISAPHAAEVMRAAVTENCRHLLDVGGASGTWTLAFLWMQPQAGATLFDLPAVIPMAEQRLRAAGALERVRLVAGDYLRDPLPEGADLAWVSAIIHQNSRAQNRQLFRSLFAALVPGGRLAIRDLIMEEGRTRPVAGALFALNMLVGTDGGGTYTFEEIREDLEQAGFREARVARNDGTMNSVITASRPPVPAP